MVARRSASSVDSAAAVRVARFGQRRMTDQTQHDFLLHDPFPEPEPTLSAEAAPGPRSPRRLSGRPRTWTAVVVVVLLIAGAGGVWAATGSSAATYRWATVGKGEVDETLDSYGTVQPLNQAAVAFPVSGTVATVPVAVGQHVTTGQPLAAIDVSSLQAQLDQPRSALATAQAKLVSDTQAQADGTSVSTVSDTLGPADTGSAAPLAAAPSAAPSGDPSGRSSGGSGGQPTGASGSAAQSAVTAAQAKLLTDQQSVDGLLASLAADLRSGTTTCGSLITLLQGLGSGSAAPQSTASASPTSSAPTPPASVPDTTACTSSLTKVLDDQQAVTGAQNTVGADETALTGAVAALVAAARSEPTPTTTPTPTPTPRASRSGTSGTSGTTGGTGSVHTSTGGSGGASTATGSTGAGRTGGGGASTPVTAQQLVVDQATVDADAAAVTVAQQAVKQATLVSPLTGTGAEVSVKVGSSVTAQSPAVTVIGPGADQVTTTVGDLDLEKVHVGADATVTPDGTFTPVHGKVTATGLLPVSTTSTGASSGGGTAFNGLDRHVEHRLSVEFRHVSGHDQARERRPVRRIGCRCLDRRHELHGRRHCPDVGGDDLRHVALGHDAGGGQSGTQSRRGRRLRPHTDADHRGLALGDRVALARMNEPLPASGTTTITGRSGAGAGGFTRGGGTTTRGRPARS